MAYKCYVLNKINLDADGNKITCTVRKGDETAEFDINAVYQAFKSGIYIKNAIDRHGELGITSTNSHFQDLSGLAINEWTVIEYLGNKYWRCRCSCGVIRAVAASSLLEDRTKCCGHDRLATRDLTGQVFGDWKVLGYCGPSTRRWKCQCINCGKIKERLTDSLYYLHNTKCDCNNDKHPYNFIDLTGQQFEHWTVKGLSACQNSSNTLWDCVCDCNPSVVHQVSTRALRQGLSTSCGCKSMVSKQEKEIKTLIESFGFSVELNNRKLIAPKEIDVYVPEKSFAIEFNGIRWHTDDTKSKYYHRQKTQACEQQNIKLLHIFDYEWRLTRTHTILVDIIKRNLDVFTLKIGARETTIKYITNENIIRNFLDENHLQGYYPAQYTLGLFYKDELVELMSFGLPRYDKTADFELIRLCSKLGTLVVGGASKLFNTFIAKYQGKSIVTYCDVAKFDGKVYEQLGMTFEQYTEPSYIYTNGSYNSVLHRQQCMKHKLIANGWGTAEQTEEEIMRSNGYSKVYDCGCKRYRYIV